MADQLVDRYKDTPVKFAQMDTDKPLNQMFRELLEESASEADVDAIIHGSYFLQHNPFVHPQSIWTIACS